jgi:hypothetical protein
VTEIIRRHALDALLLWKRRLLRGGKVADEDAIGLARN